MWEGRTEGSEKEAGRRVREGFGSKGGREAEGVRKGGDRKEGGAKVE